MEEVESLERATIAAVPPQALEEVQGWLVAIDDGTVGRAHSAAPLRHDAADVDIEAIEARYEARGLKATLRIPQLASFDGLRERLQRKGYQVEKPTLVQTAAIQPREPDGEVRIATSPDDRWSAVFLGEGFDPVDAASRLAILRRSRDSVYASVEQDGRVAAVGSACFSHGWCGIHGMRTAPAYRGRGMATRILAAFAQEAQRRGVERAFLQVEQGNTAAQSVYRRLGFTTAWVYEYWRK